MVHCVLETKPDSWASTYIYCSLKERGCFDFVGISLLYLRSVQRGVYTLASQKIPPPRSKILLCFCGFFCSHFNFIMVFLRFLFSSFPFLFSWSPPSNYTLLLNLDKNFSEWPENISLILLYFVLYCLNLKKHYWRKYDYREHYLKPYIKKLFDEKVLKVRLYWLYYLRFDPCSVHDIEFRFVILFILPSSVSDPPHFDVDPDPGIHIFHKNRKWEWTWD